MNGWTAFAWIIAVCVAIGVGMWLCSRLSACLGETLDSSDDLDW